MTDVVPGSIYSQLDISDGDIIKNQVHNLEVIPLGIDKWTYSRTRHQYGNKEFILNCIDYLMDESELINARNKSIELRMLDLKKIKEQSFFWKTLNTILPILIVVVFGGLCVKFYLNWCSVMLVVVKLYFTCCSVFLD